MTPFPHHYIVSLRQRQLVAPPRAPIAAGPPPQFGGSETDWSPEEMLVGAALECLWTTFESIARREALTVDDWSGTAHGVLDRGPAGPQFTSITLAVAMTVDAPDEARARTLLEKAERTCIISRALAVPITLDVAITCRGIAHAGSTRTEPQEGAHECSRIDDHATSHVSRQ